MDNNISYESTPIAVSDTFFNQLKSFPGITNVECFATKPGILKTDTDFQGIVLKGVDQDYDWTFFLKNGEQVMKRIVYFLGNFSGQVVRIQESEVTGAFLMDYPTAMKAFQYESSRRILKEANDYILSIGL